MAHTFNKFQNHIFRKIIASFVSLTFVVSLITGPVGLAHAQYISNLPKPGAMVLMSPKFTAPALMGMTLHPENPLAFDFIVHRGQDKLSGEPLKAETTKLLKYFLAAMTMPEDDSWVNLSPYEGDRIIPDALAVTEMGKAMLEQDYLLKQLSASLTSPETDLGKKFWEQVYKKAYEKYGSTNVPISTFNKVWITPDSATILEQDGYVFIGDSHLKVMLDQDYTSIKENLKNEKLGHEKMSEQQVADINEISSQVVRELIVPELEKEVNSGKNFASVRQMYNSVILAAWYKKNLKESLLGKVYVDKKKVNGVVTDEKDSKQKVYDQYVEAFRKGVYNLIKEDYDLGSKEALPRKYFSGGLVWTNLQTRKADASSAIQIAEQYSRGVNSGDLFNVAMLGTEAPEGKAVLDAAQKSVVAASGVQQMTGRGTVASYTIDVTKPDKGVYISAGNVLLELVPQENNFSLQVIGLIDENNLVELLPENQRSNVTTFSLNKAIVVGRRGAEGVYAPPLSDSSLSRTQFSLEVSDSNAAKVKIVKITHLSESNPTGRTRELTDFPFKKVGRQVEIREGVTAAIVTELQEAVLRAEPRTMLVTGRSFEQVEATFEMVVDAKTGLTSLGGLPLMGGLTVEIEVLRTGILRIATSESVPQNLTAAVQEFNERKIQETTQRILPVQTALTAAKPYLFQLANRNLLAFVVTSAQELTDDDWSAMNMTIFRDPLTGHIMVNYSPVMLGDIAKESKTLKIGESLGIAMGDGKTVLVSNESVDVAKISYLGGGQVTLIPQVSSSAIIGLAELTKIKPEVLLKEAQGVAEFAWTFTDREKALLLGESMSDAERQRTIEGIKANDRKRDIASRYLRSVITHFSADGWREELKKMIETILSENLPQDVALKKFLNSFLESNVDAAREITKFVQSTINPDLPAIQNAQGNMTPEVLAELLSGDLHFFLTPEIFFKEFDVRVKPVKSIYTPASNNDVLTAYRYLAESMKSIPVEFRNTILSSIRDHEFLSEQEKAALMITNDLGYDANEMHLTAMLNNGRKVKVLVSFLTEVLVFAKPEEWENIFRTLWNLERDQKNPETRETFMGNFVSNHSRFLPQVGIGLILRNPQLANQVAQETGLTGNALVKAMILRNENFPDFLTETSIVASSPKGVDANAQNVGGIDFDPSLLNLQIKRNGKGVPLPLPQQDIEKINIDGLYPVILNIQPATIQNIPFLSSNKPAVTEQANPQLSMLK